MGLIYIAVREAVRQSGKPRPKGPPKQWQPGTKAIVWFFLFAIPIAMGGAARVAALVILGVIAGSVLAAIGYCAAHRNDARPSAKRSAEDRLLDDLFGEEGRKP